MTINNIIYVNLNHYKDSDLYVKQKQNDSN